MAQASNNIPLFDFPDDDVLTSYYYRWRLFREHLDVVDGLCVIDEFLPGTSPGRGAPPRPPSSTATDALHIVLLELSPPSLFHRHTDAPHIVLLELVPGAGCFLVLSRVQMFQD